MFPGEGRANAETLGWEHPRSEWATAGGSVWVRWSRGGRSGRRFQAHCDLLVGMSSRGRKWDAGVCVRRGCGCRHDALEQAGRTAQCVCVCWAAGGLWRPDSFSTVMGGAGQACGHRGREVYGIGRRANLVGSSREGKRAEGVWRAKGMCQIISRKVKEGI